MTLISLYSNSRRFFTFESTVFAVSHKEQFARVKSVMRAVCCRRAEEGFMMNSKSCLVVQKRIVLDHIKPERTSNRNVAKEPQT